MFLGVIKIYKHLQERLQVIVQRYDKRRQGKGDYRTREEKGKKMGLYFPSFETCLILNQNVDAVITAGNHWLTKMTSFGELAQACLALPAKNMFPLSLSFLLSNCNKYLVSSIDA